MITGLAFVDFRKAFDVINHELSLKKLYIYGANDLSLKWFGSYFTGRKQYVRICGCCSTSKQLLQEVPQRSILGPILFILFVSDMPLSIRDSTLDVYARCIHPLYSIVFSLFSYSVSNLVSLLVLYLLISYHCN